MPELTLSVQHHRGSFNLDVALSITRWPALLFGPSGAGKSTLLRILAGLDRPDTGRIVLNRRVLTATQQRQFYKAGSGMVQLVSQRPALFPHLDVRANVAFGIRHLSAEERDARVAEMLALLGAAHLAERKIVHLSGGERQRIALARALAPNPQLLLLDEAFTGLDGAAKQEILSELADLLTRRNVLALHVTHEIADAFAIDAEVFVMRQGKIVAQGSAQEVLATEREQLLKLLG